MPTTTTPPPDFEQTIAAFQADCGRILKQVGRVMVGQDQVIRQTLVCLLAGGHVLLEGVPGLGKTLLVRTLGSALDLSFSRIQFTPDLMPADITGTNVVVSEEGAKAFRFQEGPIFAHLVLADEINRATPKTQSAVLEAMQEGTVSSARTTYRLPSPFMVLATQNPLEMEGTYPLPEAQLDRFMLKVQVEWPALDELVGVLERTTGAIQPQAQKAADAEAIQRMRAAVRQVECGRHVMEAIGRLVLATHPTPQAGDEVRKYVRYGSSPRGAQAILLGAKVLALMDGRPHVSLDDVRTLAAPALRHRLILTFEGQADGVTTDRIVAGVIEAADR